MTETPDNTGPTPGPPAGDTPTSGTTNPQAPAVIGYDSTLAVQSYVLALRLWLGTQNLPGTLEPNPLLGRWNLSDGAGMIEFGLEGFHWYRDGADLAGDCYCGSYGVIPGTRVHQGFILDRGTPATSCFSVVLHHTLDCLAGDNTPVDRYGLLFVEQLGRADQLGVYNHRTAWRGVASKLAEN